MAGAGDMDEAARLEAALERIARSRIGAQGHPVSAQDKSALGRRLDVLIAELRAVLGRDSAD